MEIGISSEEEPEKRWHIYNSLLSKEEIERIHFQIKQGRHMHFWKYNKMIVLFKGKKFIFDTNNKATWKKAIDYGLSINIQEEQLDFEMEF